MGLHTIHALETLMKVSQIIDVFAAGSDGASDDGSGIMLCFRPYKTTTLGRPYIAEHLQQRTGVRGHLQGKPMISVLLSVIEVSHDVVPPAGQKIRLAPHARPRLRNDRGHSARKIGGTAMVGGRLPES